MIFQDRGGVGRVLTLNPCRWIDGWPMLGDTDGKVPESFEKRLGSPADGIVASDDFSDGRKSILWEWNHNPMDEYWSLDERPGHLRLKTPAVATSIFDAPNTITQRMEGPRCEAEIKLDVSGMKIGDVAGFAAFNGDSGLLSITKDSDGHHLVASSSSVSLGGTNHSITNVIDKVYARIPLDKTEIYLKIKADFTPGRDIATFFYSHDGNNWQSIGQEFKMIFDYRRLFMGTRFAIYNYATTSTGGYVDVDYFKYSKIR